MAGKASGKSGSKKKNNNTSIQKKSAAIGPRVEDKALSDELKMEIVFFSVAAVAVFLLFSNFGLCGKVGDVFSGFNFGVFGIAVYALPFYLAGSVLFILANRGNKRVIRKIIWIGVALVIVDMIAQLIAGTSDVTAGSLYMQGYENHTNGGFIFGGITVLISKLIGVVGCIIVIIFLAFICVLEIIEKSMLSVFKAIGGFFIGIRDDLMGAVSRSNEARDYDDGYDEEEYDDSYDDDYDDYDEDEYDNRKNRRRNDRVESRSRDKRISKKDGRINEEYDDDYDDDIYEEAYRKSNSRGGRKSEPDYYEEDYDILDIDPDAAKMVAERRKNRQKSVSDNLKVQDNSADAMNDGTGDEVKAGKKNRNNIVHEEEVHEIRGTAPAHYLKNPLNKNDNSPSDDLFSVKDDVDGNAFDRKSVADGQYRKADYYDYSSDSAFTDEDDSLFEENDTAFGGGAYGDSAFAPSNNSNAFADSAFAPSKSEAAFKPAAKKSVKAAATVAASSNDSSVQKTDAQIKPATQTKTLSAEKAKKTKAYKLPPLSLLKAGKAVQKGSASELRDGARKLTETLASFGVNVSVTDCSVGPSVIRYEIQPEVGTKVARIVNLADDIKLNMAVSELRIEAPIPGKAAVGIEIPNKDKTAVLLREILEDPDYKNMDSKMAFAVGKDISGKNIVVDVEKLIHLLIAGSTGSGKSVCVNTLIMSILYKARPEDVRMIMVDPKMVELAVYNGIPHLLIPVVTDPKKAAGALNWAVAEMTKRYQLFAKYDVRGIQGFNKKVEEFTGDLSEKDPDFKKLPRIVIIVDELADLMMVAKKEVEDSIVRLTQLARAAGIHLVIATQRPSVDVITGLIKANTPSRIAFKVASGIDSRTILDRTGAENLLGKGDMLLFPTGYPQPVRVQGPFVSDEEVAAVVDFIKTNNVTESGYDEEVSKSIENAAVSSSSAGGSDDSAGDGAEDKYDEYFEDAARLIIDKDKASIGSLQRVFRIGFNRAARIMDQLCEAGVVGPEEGTKPRQILMTMSEFEEYLNGMS